MNLGSAIVSKNLDNSVLPTQSELAAAVSPSLAAKQPGSEKFLSELVAEAALAVMPTSPKDFNVDSVRVVKVLGGGLDHSRVVRGMVFGREAEGESLMAKNLAQEADDHFRYRQEGYQGQGCRILVWYGHWTDGNKGHGAAEERQRAAGFLKRRGEAIGGREYM